MIHFDQTSKDSSYCQKRKCFATGAKQGILSLWYENCSKTPKSNDSDAAKNLKWLPMSMRRDMHTINLTFKCLKGSPPMFFKDYFKVFRTIHNTRGSGHNLLLPKVRTEMARKSFYFNGSKLLIILQVKWGILNQLWSLKLVFWNYIVQNFFSYMLSFFSSLAFKCVLIAVFFKLF